MKSLSSWTRIIRYSPSWSTSSPRERPRILCSNRFSYCGFIARWEQIFQNSFFHEGKTATVNHNSHVFFLCLSQNNLINKDWCKKWETLYSRVFRSFLQNLHLIQLYQYEKNTLKKKQIYTYSQIHMHIQIEKECMCVRSRWTVQVW